jgi:hypothetical protein
MKDHDINLVMRRMLIVAWFAISSLLLSSSASAGDNVRVETVLTDLRGPAGIAIRQVPGADGYEIYVAEVGAGRIVRLSSNKPSESREAITGFIASTDEDDLIRLPGPHGLLFLDTNRLVVAGSEGETRPFVRLYELTGEVKPLTAEQYDQQASPAAGEEKSDDAVAAFHRMARTRANDKVPDFLVLSAIAKNHTATLWRLPVQSGTLGDLRPLNESQPAAPSMSITVEPRGYIVIIRPDERDASTASRMDFVNPINGRTEIKFPLRLANIVGVAYSTRTGNLFAITNSPRESVPSGVYRIDLDESSDSNGFSARATVVAKVQRPTSLAFGPDGALYVASLGRSGKDGQLKKISGDL